MECAAKAATKYKGPKLGKANSGVHLDGLRVVLLGVEANRRYGTLVGSLELGLRLHVDGHSRTFEVHRTEEVGLGLCLPRNSNMRALPGTKMVVHSSLMRNSEAMS